jgi:hypothetical protein
MSALHSVLRDRLHHAENVVEGAQRAYASALEEARDAGIEAPEPSVQVPVSLIERIEATTNALRHMPILEAGSGVPDVRFNLNVVTEHFNAIFAAVSDAKALLSQPTPSAVLTGGIGYPVREAAQREDDRTRNVAIAAPPSIADMVPGTTFEYGERWTVGHNLPDQPPHAHRGLEARYLDQFDPSTIRDVTPPPVTP